MKWVGMDGYDWEPASGFCALNRNSNIELAAALEVVRRKICAYNMGTRDKDVRCDCKYGATPEEARYIGSENTGCPELREVIYRLLHAPESFGEDNA